MQRKTLLASAATLLIAGSATFAFAQDGTTPPPAAPAASHAMQSPKDAPKGRPDAQRGDQHGWGGHGRDGGMRGEGGVIGDLRGLERLYIMQGRAKDLPALYNEVLAKSQNPRVRDYAYRHLARAQMMQPANVDQAIATMRKSLDESLAQDAKRQAAMEQWRATKTRATDIGNK
ncbi:hypothetical protein EC912_104213 [Luteibacter rhizovicinus]|uniref:Uncharacterized protein n=1 Tax=Luteibacter rhizovicinus TaxID=242606 RepID=A0A4R3YNV8_9GAMM|nr:hypothetical protein [Luteibacter rhizovicinus]TCV94016.1 hypothetical protein EC912_104213 [Luteibacter rhizovicinus]